jgi:CBS domain-containing membrane protein
MKRVSELMTTELLSHQPGDTLRDAEQTMAQHHIRHIPIVDEQGQLCGLMSQREFLAEAFRITDKFGAHHLKDYLGKTLISQCMQTRIATVKPETLLKEAGETLRANRRQGCLLVVDNENFLVGMLTSQDFVKLAVHLLEG